jgi:hypothetical protein
MNIFGQLVSLLNNLVAGHSPKRRKKQRRKKAASGRRRKPRRVGRGLFALIPRPRAKKAVKIISRRRIAGKKSLAKKKMLSAKRGRSAIHGEPSPQRRGSKVLLSRRDNAKSRRQVAVLSMRQSPSGVDPNAKALFVGDITHYFSKIMVCVVAVKGCPLSVGRKIRIEGKTSSFVQAVKSLQVESVDVRQAKKGQLVGLKVIQAVKEGDKVYLS